MTAKSTAMHADEYASVASMLIGASLTDVAMTRYFYPRSGSGVDQDCFLRFDPADWVAFKCGSDGHGLRIDVGQSPEAFDMEDLGYVTVVTVASDRRFAGVLLATLDSVNLISVRQSIEPIGVELNFRTGSVQIFNWGDELLVTNELPTFVVSVDGRPAAFQHLSDGG